MQMKSRLLHPELAAHGWEVPSNLAASACGKPWGVMHCVGAKEQGGRAHYLD